MRRHPPRLRFSETRRRRHKLLNLAHSLLLLAGMLGILALCAWLVWGGEGILWALVLGGLTLLLTPSVAPEWVMRMYRAVPLGPRDCPDCYAILEALAARADLEQLPRLYYIRSPVLNAFAVGRRDQAAIGVTDGLIRTLSTREFAGVLAHELSHVRNDDLWIMNLADLMSRLTSLLSWVGQLLLLLSIPAMLIAGTAVPLLLVLTLILAPTAVSLLQLALSRAREYDADLDAAALTGDPQGLASALARLERLQGRYWEEIFLPGRRMPEPSLLRTHPPTRARIERLMALYEEAEPVPIPVLRPTLPGFATQPPESPRFRWTGAWY